MIAEALSRKPFISHILPVDTNIIIAEVHPPMTPSDFVQHMQDKKVLLFSVSPTRFRMVLHLDITPEMVAHTIKLIEEI
jgi:threonine aldolase